MSDEFDSNVMIASPHGPLTAPVDRLSTLFALRLVPRSGQSSTCGATSTTSIACRPTSGVASVHCAEGAEVSGWSLRRNAGMGWRRQTRRRSSSPAMACGMAPTTTPPLLLSRRILQAERRDILALFQGQRRCAGEADTRHAGWLTETSACWPACSRSPLPSAR